jgi:hypothetical protein
MFIFFTINTKFFQGSGRRNRGSVGRDIAEDCQYINPFHQAMQPTDGDMQERCEPQEQDRPPQQQAGGAAAACINHRH